MKLDRTRDRLVGAALAAALLGVAAIAAVTLPALAGSGYAPAKAQREKPVAGRSVPPGRIPANGTGRPFTAPAPQWPKPAVAEVALTPAGGDQARAVRAGDQPVLVAATTTLETAPAKVRVETLDRTVLKAVGSDGLLVRVSTLDRSGPVRLTVDYTRFRWAYGADWASRLRLAELPTCALTTPAAPDCRARPLATDNNVAAGTASATLTVQPGGSLLALSAGPSGSSGDYAASPLSPSGTWSAGGNSGDFSWSYPMRMPPSLGGPVPGVSLSYSSSSVDGRMAASNNQPSWIGEGFDFSPGAVVRSYVPCATDKREGANNTQPTGDDCWLADNATLSMPGHAGELIRESPTSNRWHLRHDDGTFVERRTGAGNGALGGEWWVATTTDGTQYWFGGQPASNSALLMPVFGNHPGEPCHQATFAASSCTQAYQWNLDHVVDPHGNTMTYVYAKETNRYARNRDPMNPVQYDRSGYLVRIEYGTRTDRTEAPPMQVLFGTVDRCLADCATHDAAHWPDTPWDLECTGAPCPNPAPTFWTTRRLTTVTTRVGPTDVERWTLRQSFPNPGDSTRAGLWLDRISHNGLVGGDTPVPDVAFAGVQMANRVDASDPSPAMNWWRIKTITTETGGLITVTYSDPDCIPGSRMPDVNALQNNTLRCFPVKWRPAGVTDPVTDFFHKYVVTDVVESDLTPVGAPRTRTHYDYLDPPAWHYTDDNGLIPADADKTWSVFRGYGWVRTTRGDPGEQTVEEQRFFRGMHGDHLPGGGAREVGLPAIAVGNVPAVNDEDVYAGMLRESVTYNGPGGAEVSATVYEPWQSPPTAERTVNRVTVAARFVKTAGVHTRTALDKGRAPRTTSTRTVFDVTYGMPVSVEDRGDDAVTGDERCTLMDYARNPAAWIVSTISRTRGFAVDCGRAAAGGLGDDDVVADERISYDGQAFGAPPPKGDITRSETMRSYNNGTPAYITTVTTTYDRYGRVRSGTDVRGKVTTTDYTPADGGPLTAMTQTTNGDWTVTVSLAPAWQQPLSTVDANGRRTDLAYDGLGRLVSVWKPGRDRATQSPNLVHEYRMRNNAPTTVTTRALKADGGYVTSHTLYDNLLRVRQTQSPDAAGGSNAVVTDTYYDTVGRVVRTNSPYLSTVPPGTELFAPTEVIPAQTVTRYDGAGRTATSVFMVRAPAGGSPGGVERWRTTTGYGGDRTDVTPPAGGTATSMVFDARGQKVELRQYHAGVAPGGDDPAGFDRTRYRYNRKGKLATVTDPAGNTWTYGYDLLGRQISNVDPDKATITATYTDAGDLETNLDARNKKVIYTYDTMGRKTGLYAESVTPNTQLAKWEYDRLGDGTRVVDQLVRTTRFFGGEAYVKEVNGFTLDYQPNRVTYTVPVGQGGLAGSYTYVYTYRDDGSPETVRLPAIGDLNTETLTYGYDGLGQPRTVDSNYGTNPRTSLVKSTGYTSFGEMGAYTLRNNGGNAVDVARTYETDTRRLGQIWTTKQTAPTTVADLRYSYDPGGNVTRIADLTSGDTQCFRTDTLRRLTDAWTPASGDCAANPTAAGLGGPARYWQSYGYDAVGNRTSLVEHATPAGDRTTDYVVPGGRHLVTTRTTTDATGTTTGTHTYDEVGNMRTRPAGAAGTQTMTWDVEGHLATSTDGTGTTSYVYDTGGQRLVRRDPAGATLYLPGQELRVSASGGVRTASRYYSHGGQVVAVRAGSGLTWLSGDAQGTAQISVTALNQKAAIRRQTPFGVPRDGSGIWPSTMDKGFVGGTNDNTGLTHLGAREYDPALGRFISRDSIVDTSDPQQMNGYSYSGNNPTTYSDPDGLCYGREEGDLCPGHVRGPWAPTPAGDQARARHFPRPSGRCPANHCGTPASGGGMVDGCGAHTSASNCETPTRHESPWDVISVTSYPHGTTLTVFRNGMMAIDGQLLPEGVVDPWELARRVDKQFGRGERNPHNNLITSGYINAACTLELCTRDFAHAMDQIHYWYLTHPWVFESTMSGVCFNASAFFGMEWGFDVCAFSGGNGATYVSMGYDLGLGFDLSGSGTLVTVHTMDPTKLCGNARYASASVGPFSANHQWQSSNENPVHIFAGDPIDGSLTTGAGLGVGLSPVAASIGKSDTFVIWQFGGGEFGKNICR